MKFIFVTGAACLLRAGQLCGDLSVSQRQAEPSKFRRQF
jgi:hypothetical protein